MVANVSDSSFPHIVGGCGEGCEICVRATSCNGDSEEACVHITKGQCSELTSTSCVVDVV